VPGAAALASSRARVAAALSPVRRCARPIVTSAAALIAGLVVLAAARVRRSIVYARSLRAMPSE
jgi:hypothetical protein